MQGRIAQAFAGKKVFLTGHTGFKGSWLSLWLAELGAEVTGYSLAPATDPSLFVAADVASRITSVEGDIRDLSALGAAMKRCNPDVVLHLAAQALVPYSYREPVETFASNVMGTVNVLECVRHNPQVQACVVVSSDKCYENIEQHKHYEETDPMGGYDPYSASKGCTELVVSSYQRSFFGSEQNTLVASARAGNVIGGGDWAEDRLVPDIVRAMARGEKLVLRNPAAVRPWQHVLEPLAGYLWLATRLLESGRAFAEGWNFGPEPASELTVESLVKIALDTWGEGAYEVQSEGHPHEAQLLQLSIDKAQKHLQWHPVWSAEEAIQATVGWYRQFQNGVRDADLRDLCVGDIERYAARMSYDRL